MTMINEPDHDNSNLAFCIKQTSKQPGATAQVVSLTFYVTGLFFLKQQL